MALLHAVVDGWPHLFLVSTEDIQSDQEITAELDDREYAFHNHSENLCSLHLTSASRPDHCAISEYGTHDSSNIDNSSNGQHDHRAAEAFCEEEEHESESESDVEEKRALEESIYVESEVRMRVVFVV